MPDTPFPLPEGKSQEEIMAYWERYNKIVSENPNAAAELNERDPLFRTFSGIKDMNADVVFSTDVDEPDNGSGAALVLRLLGASGQGLLSFGGAPGIIAGIGLNTVLSGAANAIDQRAGIPSEAVPFSGLVSDLMDVENPMTTSDPIVDALAESGIDSLAGLGVMSKMGHSARQILGKGSFSEYFASRINPQFVEDMKRLQGAHGLNIPLNIKQEGIGGTVGRTLSTLSSHNDAERQLVQQTTKGLEDAWRNAFKLDIDNSRDAEEIISGFNSGLETGRKLRDMTGLLPHEREAIVGMARFNRVRERNFLLRDSTKLNFEKSTPKVDISNGTGQTITNAIRRISALGISGDPKLNGIVKSLSTLRDNIVRPATREVKKHKNGMVTTFSPSEQLLDSTKNKEAPTTILNLIDGIDRKIGSLDSLPESIRDDVAQHLHTVRESINADILNSLDPAQRQLYDKYRLVTDQINSAPQRIIDNVSAGEFSGFMETLIKDKTIARNFMQQGIVTPDEAKAMVGEYLLYQGKKTADNGDELIDFVKIKNFVDKPENREGIVEMLGSNDLGLFRQFANVAANTKPFKSGDQSMKNVLMYGSGAMMLFDPMMAAQGLGVALTANQFMKKILFNPKVGAQAIEMLKTPTNSKQARKAYGLMMAALNGHEATAIFLDEKGETVGERQIVIRNRPNGPVYYPLE